MEKPWIFDVPILKSLSLILLFLHIIGIPLVFCLNLYYDFFKTTDFIKLIVITTAIGAIFTCAIFGILLIREAVARQHNAREVKVYEVILIDVLICYIVVDIVVVLLFFKDSKLVPVHDYIFYHLSVLFSLMLFPLVHSLFRKKDISEVNETSTP